MTEADGYAIRGGYAFKVAPSRGARVCFTFVAKSSVRRSGKQKAQWKQERKSK